MSQSELLHSLIDTIRNVASIARLDFFVIFQQQDDKSSRRFAGTEDFLELFMRYDLLPHHNDVRVDVDVAVRHKETLIGDLIPLDAESADVDDYDQDKGIEIDDDDSLPRITETFSFVPVTTERLTPTPVENECVVSTTRSGRKSIKPSTLSVESPQPTTNGRAKPIARQNEMAIARAKTKKGKSKRGAFFGGRKKEPMSRCETCGRLFFSRFNMLRHVENVHLRILPYVCKICDRGFPQKNSMQKHIKTLHGSKKSRKMINNKEATVVVEEGMHAVYHMSDDQFDVD